jgi:hypothetical protein
MMLCLAEAIGVPGMFGQPPTWPGVDVLNGNPAWTNTNSVSSPRGLDDPRWQGNLAIGYPAIEPAPVSCCGGAAAVDPGFGSASTEDVAFRALYDDANQRRFLYLSWWVKAADLNSPLDDALTVGFSRGAGEALVLRITPSTSPATTSAGPIGPVSVSTAGAAGGAVHPWTENQGRTPVWINQNTHVWLDTVSHRWAIQMRVPIGSGDVDRLLDLPDPFKMWFEVGVRLPSDLVAPYSWPRNACVASYCGFPSQLHVPAVGDWGDFHLSTGPADPACMMSNFVRLVSGDVGTQNTPTSNINLTSPNVFEAKPENLTGATVAAQTINAQFRIADWGSVADPAAPWMVIPATGGTTNPAPNTAAIANGAKGSLTMQWQLSAAERAQYPPTGTKPRHQCILVTLGGGQVFNPASVWRNMDFVSASRFERRATVSNVGLGASPVPGGPRPAYVLVERLSMPPVPPRRGSGPESGGSEPDGRGVADDDEATRLLAAAALQAADPVDRLELQPTVRYHVYHDTGLDIATATGSTLRVVRPGTAFGYHVRHDGVPRGWQEQVLGATRLTERFYRLDVPEEGTADITTVVEAVENRGCLNLFALLWDLLRKIFGGS